MQLKKVMLAFAMMLGLVATSFAQDADKKQDKQLERVVKNTAGQLMKFYAPAKLTDEQKKSAMAVIKTHAKKIMELRKAQDKLLSDEQKKARKEAIAKAKEEGVKGQKMFEVGFKAMELSEEEKKAFDKARKSSTELMTKIKSEINKELTEEQVASLKKGKGKKGGQKGKKGKKKKDADGDGKTQTVSLKLPNMT
ncbi:MAG: hypothetical protein AAFN77_02765 [Planctomycetota bacterium]